MTSPVRLVVRPCADGKLRRGGGGGGDLEGFSVRYLATLRSTANRERRVRTTSQGLKVRTGPLTRPPVGQRPLHAVQLLGGQLHFAQLLVAARRGGGGVVGGGGSSVPSGGGSGDGGGYWDGDLGLRGHCGFTDLSGSKVQVWDGLHQLRLGLLQQAVDVLSTELGQTGPFLLPVPLSCLEGCSRDEEQEQAHTLLTYFNQRREMSVQQSPIGLLPTQICRPGVGSAARPGCGF